MAIPSSSQTTANDTSTRKNVRLTGVAYEKLIFENNWDKYNASDEYYLVYEGKKGSTLHEGYKYHNVNILHRKIGHKHFCIHGGTPMKTFL